MSVRSPRVFVVVLVLAIAVSGCALTPTSAPTTAPAPTPSPTVQPVAPVQAGSATAAPVAPEDNPSGQVLWNGAPVASARLKLARPGACIDGGPDTVLATATAGADGKFAFPTTRAGEWELCAAWPQGSVSDTFTWVPLEAGQPVNDVTVRLLKPIKLLSPDLARPVDGAFEVSWEGVPGVTNYSVNIVDLGTSELFLDQAVTGASLAVTRTLKPGHGYLLSVDGLGAENRQVARVSGEFKAAGEPTLPQNEPVQQLPANCYREGLPTYVDRAARLCFAYPQGFTLAGNAGTQAQAEIRGPAVGSGLEPLFASLSLEFWPYQGQELGAFVDELLKTKVPADFPARVERKQATFAGHAVELLEPVPGRLSSRVVVVDAAPQGYHILTFWPSFKDTPAAQMTSDAVQAQRDMEALYEIVTSSFSTLPPAGVPIDPVTRFDLPKSCLVDGQPLYIDANDNYCFVLTPQMAARREANGRVGFYGPALDKSPEPVRVELGLTVEVAARDAALDKIVDGYGASHKDLASMIMRSPLTVGGVPAVRLDNIPGRPTATEVLLLHDGTLFQFRFTPDQSFAAAKNDVNDLIQAVTSSFGFLPG